MFRKNNNSDYIYVVAFVGEVKMRYAGWMRGNDDSLDYFKSCDIVDGGVLTATYQEIIEYELREDVKKYNL